MKIISPSAGKASPSPGGECEPALNCIVTARKASAAGSVLLRAAFFLLLTLCTLVAQPGSLDVAFDPGDGADGPVYALALQPDGRLVMGGEFTGVNGGSRNGIARLNKNGHLDASFDPGLGVTGCVFAVTVQTDGKIVIGGDFDSVNGAAHDYVARLNTNGTVDAGFDYTPDGLVYALAYSAGQLFLGGDFTAIDRGTTTYYRNYVAKITTSVVSWNTAGTDGLDGPDAPVWSIAVQTDGKVVIGGDFFLVTNGSTDYDRSGIARLLSSSGNPDTTFLPGTGADGTVYAVVLQSDGKILIGGSFTDVNGFARAGVARLNSNGSVDASFAPGTGADDSVLAIAVQADGKILVGGDFATFNDQPRYGLARLNANGSLDTNFNAGDYLDGSVYAIAIQPDGQILIGGDFSYVGDTERASIARLNGEQAPTIQTQPVSRTALPGSQVVFSVATAGPGPFSYQWFSDGAPLSNDGRIVGATSSTLTIANVDFPDTADFTVVVSNAVGAVLSQPATLTLSAPLFNPGSLSYSNGVFSFTVSASGCPALIIEASTNLAQWLPIFTNLAPNSSVIFSDPAAGELPHRYYRAVCP